MKLNLNIWDLKIHKKIFYITNAIFWILGWGSLGIGIWLYVEKNSYSLLAPSSYSAMSTAGLYISAGIMVLIVAVIGCLGSWMPSKFLLLAYICFVSLLLVVQAITGFMGHFQEEHVKHRVKFAMYTTINRTQKLDNYPINQLAVTWDEMQSALECCGVESYKDWFNSSGWPKNSYVPDSCCDPREFADTHDALFNCGKTHQNEDKWFKVGCHDLFTDWLLQHTRIIGICSLMFVITEVIILVTAFRILQHVRKSGKQNYPTVQYRRGNRSGDGADHEAHLVQ